MAQFNLNDLIDFFSKKNELDSNLIDEAREKYHEQQGNLLESRDMANEDAKNLEQFISQNVEPKTRENPIVPTPYSYQGPVPLQDISTFPAYTPILPPLGKIEEMSIPEEISAEIKSKTPIKKVLPKISPVKTEIPMVTEGTDNIQEPSNIEMKPEKGLPDMKAALAEAKANREQANKIDAISQLITGIVGLNSKMAPLEYKGEAAKVLREQADIPVQELKELKASQKEDIDLKKAKFQLDDESQQRDANSDISKALRTFILDQGKVAGMANLAIPEGLSYNALQKMYGHITDVFNAKLKSDTLKESIRQRQQEKQFKLSDQITTQDDKAAKSLQKDLDPNMNSRGNMARNQARVDAAERLEALAVEKDGQFVNLTPQQMNELAAGLDTLISSNPSISGREHLTPESKSKWIANRLQWLTDNPQGADQIAFSMNMVDTIRREKEVAQEQIRRVQKERLAAHKGLKQRNPNLYNEIVSNYGITDSEDTETIIDPKGVARQIPKSQVEAALKAGGKRPK